MPYVVSRVIDRVQVEVECVHCGALYTVDRGEDGWGDGPKICSGCENHDCFETLDYVPDGRVFHYNRWGVDPPESPEDKWRCWICGTEFDEWEMDRHHERAILKDFFEGFIAFLQAVTP